MASLMIAGYAFACWQLYYAPKTMLDFESKDQKALLSQVVVMERQLQIEHAARDEVAKEMAGLQEEVMHLKEDVQFYQSILSESGATGVVRFHSTKIVPGEQPNVYRYSVVLLQSGRHDRLVEGRMRLKWMAQTESAQAIPIAGHATGVPVKFKYYQRLEGEFTIPLNANRSNVQLELVDARNRSIALSDAISLPSS